MKWWVIFLLVRATYSASVADVISNYAKVVVNDGAQHKQNVTDKPVNVTDVDDDYEDFDDATEATHRSQSSNTMLKFINGAINLLALMYKFSGHSKPTKMNQPRSDLSNSINQLAEDRYNPSTAAKKFKTDVYPPLKSYAYKTMATNGAESYGNAGKTSYDSDSSQYMVANAEKSTKMDFKAEDVVAKKSPMKDYMNQNDVDIRQSYSYEIPQNEGSHDPPAPVYYPWMSKTTAEPAANDGGWDSSADLEQKPIESYPWMTQPSHSLSDENSWVDNAEPEVKKRPIESYPWMTHDQNKPEEETYGMRPPPKSRPPPEDHHVYQYPYLDDHDIHDSHEEDHDMKDEDRESKRPYTYYHLGRKLYYVPLLFSLYFIVYVASLLLKSITRHKVQFPEKLWELNDHHHHDHGDHSRRGRNVEQITDNVFKGLENATNKYT